MHESRQLYCFCTVLFTRQLRPDSFSLLPYLSSRSSDAEDSAAVASVYCGGVSELRNLTACIAAWPSRVRRAAGAVETHWNHALYNERWRHPRDSSSNRVNNRIKIHRAKNPEDPIDSAQRNVQKLHVIQNVSITLPHICNFPRKKFTSYWHCSKRVRKDPLQLIFRLLWS